MKKFLVTILTAILATGEAAVDYCDPSLCANTGGNLHIVCNNDGKFADSCPLDARMVNLKDHINLILTEHNERRNKLGAGNISGYESAMHMATMQWSNELAYIAAYNVKKCTCEYDGCRNAKEFKYTGQNIVVQGYTGKEAAFSDAEIIQDGIENWFDEHVMGSMQYMKRYPKDFEIYKEFSHFALMATERNTHVGCAASRYKEDDYHYVLFTCNYASAALLNRTIYMEGLPASGCKTGKNPKYPALCSTSEKYQ